jgi:hypothetical protein
MFEGENVRPAGTELDPGRKGSRIVRYFGRSNGICYASALCFDVRLVLSRAKTTPQDSNCRFDSPDFEPRIATP